MGERKSGVFKKVEREVEITTCDVCGKDMEQVSADGSLSRDYPAILLDIEHVKYQYEGDESEVVDVCSYECLKQFAEGRIRDRS